MTHPLCGWKRPEDKHLLRALWRAQPVAGDSVLAGITAAPTSDNSGMCTELDQGSIGSCQSQTPAQVLWMAMVRQGMAPFLAARLALYYWIRVIEGTVDVDEGGYIGDVYSVLATLGIPPESVWPYVVGDYRRKPGPEVTHAAYDSRGKIGVNYHPIATYDKDALIADIEKACTAGYGISFGTEVTEDFCSKQPSGIIMPPSPTDKIAGGHAQTIVGHDRARGCALVKNSWGDAWGDPNLPPGCSEFSYEYLADRAYGAADVWVCLLVPKGNTP